MRKSASGIGSVRCEWAMKRGRVRVRNSRTDLDVWAWQIAELWWRSCIYGRQPIQLKAV